MFLKHTKAASYEMPVCPDNSRILSECFKNHHEKQCFGPEALILLHFPPFLGSFFESEFLLVGNPQGVKGYACISNERTGEIFPQYFINILLKGSTTINISGSIPLFQMGYYPSCCLSC